MTTNQELFIDLIHHLGDYEEAMVLQLLLAWRADQTPLRSGKRKLQEQFPTLISVAGVERAISRLMSQGLITTRVYPNTYTEYRINAEALDQLLAEPIPATKWFPGVSNEPIPYLGMKAERLERHSSNHAIHDLGPELGHQEAAVPPDVASHEAPVTTGVDAGAQDQPSINVEKQQ